MNKKIKCNAPITILGFISLICTVLSCITYFWYYDYNYVNGGNSYYELVFDFPSIISILFLLLDLAPCVLLLLYIMKFHGQYKGTVLYPIVCGLIAGSPLLSTILNVIRGYGLALAWLDVIIKLAIVISFTLLTINAIRGLNKKVYTIVATSIGLVLQLLSAISIFNSMVLVRYIETEMYLYLFTIPMGIIGTVALYIALLLFGLNNRIPALVSLSPEEKERQKTEKMTPEQSLRLLKDKLDLGMITEEEYQTQRAEIISKL